MVARSTWIKVRRGDSQVEGKKRGRSSVKQTTAVILDKAEAGALAHLQGPIYVYRGPANYPTKVIVK
jgi:hypothetical protein